jgi:hypothetical protein
VFDKSEKMRKVHDSRGIHVGPVCLKTGLKHDAGF